MKNWCISKYIVGFIVLVMSSVNSLAAEISDDMPSYFIYFTGIGCPHCANADPVLLKDGVPQENVLIIEYEIYHQRQNAPLLLAYDDAYNTGLAVPLLIAGKEQEQSVLGDIPIIDSWKRFARQYRNNDILLPDSAVQFKDMHIPALPGLPKLWYRNRVAEKITLSSPLDKEVKDFLFYGSFPPQADMTENTTIQLSGTTVTFNNAYEFSGWKFYAD